MANYRQSKHFWGACRTDINQGSMERARKTRYRLARRLSFYSVAPSIYTCFTRKETAYTKIGRVGFHSFVQSCKMLQYKNQQYLSGFKYSFTLPIKLKYIYSKYAKIKIDSFKLMFVDFGLHSLHRLKTLQFCHLDNQR